MFNLFNFQVKSANQVKLPQVSDPLWTDLSANQSASYTGGARVIRCRTKLNGIRLCVEREPGVD